jgi:8-oxo-dGTP pyrophosphatase MutT (NUDIX family)
VPDETSAYSKVPTLRDAVRAVVLDRENRVLLFKAFGDDNRSKHFWITPGGGVMAGESDRDALRRELAEECGLYESEIGPFIWVREHLFPLPGSSQLLRQRERYYLVRVVEHDVDVTGLDDFERKYLGEARWWTLKEVRSSHEEFAPRLLARYLTDLISGRIPDVPLDTGI